MKTTQIELLSPARDAEVGIAAINHGADAVYIGGPSYGAREKASNAISDIERLCRHAALYDAKVYVTLNTLLYKEELERARQLAHDCWNAGVDALIVQDLQLLDLDLPPIALHASTQCDNLTVERVQQLEQLGFSQVVLGRELSLKEIRDIREQTTVPLEFFVHGSLCVSHSGQCYLSQHIGNRSANRGACAQPCRLPYDLLDEEGRVLIRNRHLLCLKDLNNSAHIEELIDAGITSFKIEGRMKEADYVKNVTAYYRQKLDAILERRPELEKASKGHCSYSFEVNPAKSFNRGFTDFFINGRQKGIDSPFTPKSMGEYVGEVAWCNPLRIEMAPATSVETRRATSLQNDATVIHNGDGLCYLNANNELIGFRADVVKGNTISCNRPHGAHRGAKLYRNYDIEWQRQVEASTGNRKMDIDLLLSENETGYTLTALRHCEERSNPATPMDCRAPLAMTTTQCDKITANNPEKATDNIRRKALQWGDTIFNPINLELRLAVPRLIPASVIGELKRALVEQLTDTLINTHRSNRPTRPCRDASNASAASNASVASNACHCEEAQSLPRTQCGGSNPETGGLDCRAPLHSARNDERVATDPDAIPDRLMTCHHCIRYANGLCSRVTGQRATPLFLRPAGAPQGGETLRLEFDCRNCLMYVLKEA